jgi:O-antigen/teichoic acid export membrane protein
MSRGRAVLKDIRFYTAAILLTQVVTVIASLLTRRFLGPTQMGVWVFLQVLLGYAEYLALGTTAAAGYEIPLYNGRGDAEKADRVADAAFSFGLITSLLTAGAAVAYAVSLRGHLSEELFYAFLIGGGFVVLQRFNGLLITIVRAEKQFELAGRQMLYSAVVNALLIAFFAYRFRIYGFLAAMALSLLFNIVYLLMNSGIRFRFRADREQIGALVRYGFPLMLIGLVTVAFDTMDRIFITRFLGLESLGLYSVALMTMNYLNGVPNSVGVVTVSHLQEAYGQTQDTAPLRAYLKKVDAGYGILMTVLIGAAWFLMPWLVRLVLPEFTDGIPAMRVLALSAYFTALSQGYSQVIYVLRRHQALLWLAPCACVVAAAAYGLAVWQKAGLIGIAVAAGCAGFAYFTLLFFYASSRVEPLGASLRRYAGVLGLFAGMAALAFAVDRWVTGFGSAAGPWIQLAIFLAILAPVLWKLDGEFGFKERFAAKFFPPRSSGI